MEVNYKHLSKYNIQYLAIEFLSERFFKIPFTAFQIYYIISQIFLEESVLFISEDITILTTLVLGFFYLIAPFNWPFILIPNLPYDLLNMIDSPVPFLIGILGNSESRREQINSAIGNNSIIVIFEKNELILIKNNNTDLARPYLENINELLTKELNLCQYYSKIKKSVDYTDSCIVLYKSIYSNIKRSLVDNIIRATEKAYEEFIFNNKINNLDSNEKRNSLRRVSIKQKLSFDESDEILIKTKLFFIDFCCEFDKAFAEVFVDSQLFISYFDEFLDKHHKNY